MCIALSSQEGLDKCQLWWLLFSFCQASQGHRAATAGDALRGGVGIGLPETHKSSVSCRLVSSRRAEFVSCSCCHKLPQTW